MTRPLFRGIRIWTCVGRWTTGEKPYDVELLHRMYDYLTAHGDCYYIEYKGVLVGDVSLRENSEIAVVVCKEYQNQHIEDGAFWRC